MLWRILSTFPELTHGEYLSPILSYLSAAFFVALSLFHVSNCHFLFPSKRKHGNYEISRDEAPFLTQFARSRTNIYITMWLVLALYNFLLWKARSND
jgi:hypothetical protein